MTTSVTHQTKAQIPFSFPRIHLHRNSLYGFILLGALLAFEFFNFSTTEFALDDFLGGLMFSKIRWATILAIAFCGIDFAGVASLFTPERSEKFTPDVWYLFCAWLLAATMNALLTWWGVSTAISNHETLGNAIIQRETLVKAVPIFVAVMVWLIRVLIIGSFSIAGDQLFSPNRPDSKPSKKMESRTRQSVIQKTPIIPVQPIQRRPTRRSSVNPEPTYHPASMKSDRSHRINL